MTMPRDVTSIVRTVSRATILSAALLVALTSETGAASRHRPEVTATLGALQRGDTDSALLCLVSANTAGLPRDSLFYLLGEVYLKRGILDTALGLNYAAKPDARSPLREAVFRQRYAIYSLLGLEEYARQTLDSLTLAESRSPGGLVPTFELLAGGGYGSERRQPETDYPWLSSLSPPETTIAGPDANGTVGLHWRIPAWGTSVFRLSVKAGLNRPFNTTSDVLSADSLEWLGGGGAQWSGLGGVVALGCDWLRRRTYLDQYFSSTRLSLELNPRSRRVLSFATGSYSYDYAAAERDRAHNAMVMGYLGRIAAPKFAVTAVVNTHLARASVFPDSALTVIDLGASLDTMAAINRFFLSSSPDTIHSIGPATRTSNSVAGGALSVHYSHDLPWRLVAAVRAMWNVNAFIDEYVWYRLTPAQSGSAALSYIARNPADGAYYWIARTRSGTIGEDALAVFSDGPVNLERHQQRRIDNTLALGLSLDREFRYLGTWTLTGDLSRTFSSLDDNPPVYIPRWNWRVGLSWRLRAGRRPTGS